MKLSYALPVFILSSIFACKRPSESHADTVWSEHKSPTLTTTLLRDTLPYRFISNLHITEVHGVKASYSSGQQTSYYEYEADPEMILKMVSSLPFKRSNSVSDTTCRAFEIPFSMTGKRFISAKELQAANFFWQINPKDFFYYECLKNPDRHTILINKITGRILHRVESMS